MRQAPARWPTTYATRWTDTPGSITIRRSLVVGKTHMGSEFLA